MNCLCNVQENVNLKNAKKCNKSKKKCSGCDSPKGSFFAYPAIKNICNQNGDDNVKR